MKPVRASAPARQATGVIHDVDVAGREVTVVVSGGALVFDVPPECPVLLHGELVKLRLLLPGDRAQVVYRPEGGRLVACSVRVDGWPPLEAGGRPGEGRAAPPGVLLADGLGLTLVLLKLELEPLGLAVWLAQDGGEATRLYRQHHADIGLVLLDAELPGGGGPQTLAALRQIDPCVRSCFLGDVRAGYAGPDLLGCGAAAVLPRPVRPAEVARAVRRLLGDAGPHRDLPSASQSSASAR